MSYDETMNWGARQYADVLAALRRNGLPAQFVQTGGMCAAIEVQLEAGFQLLVTDAEDTLSWARVDHQGWWVGLYPPDEAGADGPIRWDQVDEGDLGSLLALIDQVMKPTPVETAGR